MIPSSRATNPYRLPSSHPRTQARFAGRASGRLRDLELGLSLGASGPQPGEEWVPPAPPAAGAVETDRAKPRRRDEGLGLLWSGRLELSYARTGRTGMIWRIHSLLIWTADKVRNDHCAKASSGQRATRRASGLRSTGWPSAAHAQNIGAVEELHRSKALLPSMPTSGRCC